MDSSKTTVSLPNELIVAELASQIALNTFIHQDLPYKDIFTDQFVAGQQAGKRLSLIELKEYYRDHLMQVKGKSKDVPSKFVNHLTPYPYLKQQQNPLDIAHRLMKQEFQNYSEDELSENDLKVQSLLSFRQYLRMIRRLLALTYFHSHQDDEFPTVSHGEVKHKYFEPEVPDAVAVRMGTYMHIPHYYKHMLNHIPPA